MLRGFKCLHKNYFGKKFNTSTTSKIEEHDQPMDINWTTIEMTDFKKKEKEVKERTTLTLLPRCTFGKDQHISNMSNTKKLSSARLVETDF